MRFENSALQAREIDAIDLDDLGGSGQPAQDPHTGLRDAGDLRDKPEDRFVRFAVNRRRRDMQLPGLPVHSFEFRLRRAGPDFKR